MLGSHQLRWMNQPVAVGSASGVASALILTLLRNLIQDSSLEVQPLQLPVECPNVDITFEDIPRCGILLGPAVFYDSAGVDLFSLPLLKSIGESLVEIPLGRCKRFLHEYHCWISS